MEYRIKFEVYNRFNHLIKEELKSVIINEPTVAEIKDLFPKDQYGNIESEIFIGNGGRRDLVDIDVVDQVWIKYIIKLN